MTMLLGSVVSAIVKEGMKEENFDKAVDFIVKRGRKLSGKIMKYLEERKDRDSKDEEGNGEIPAEIQQEVQKSVQEILEEQARPVYMGGIAFFCEKPFDDEIKEALGKILKNANDDVEGLDWVDESDIAYQGVVDDFMDDNYGRSLDENEWDYNIGENYLYLNLAFDDEEQYYRLYKSESIRKLANALNHLLGDRYITRFTTY